MTLLLATIWIFYLCVPKLSHMKRLMSTYFRLNLKRVNIQISCTIEKYAKIPGGIFGFSMLHLTCVFLFKKKGLIPNKPSLNRHFFQARDRTGLYRIVKMFCQFWSWSKCDLSQQSPVGIFMRSISICFHWSMFRLYLLI